MIVWAVVRRSQPEPPYRFLEAPAGPLQLPNVICLRCSSILRLCSGRFLPLTRIIRFRTVPFMGVGAAVLLNQPVPSC
jgi:hypothetical protein